MKQHSSRSHTNRPSSSLLSVMRGIILALLAASALPFLAFYTLPSLQLFLSDVIPSLCTYCSCDLFTPTNLFVLLNLIILSILAMAHLHSSQAASTSSSPHLPLHPAPDVDWDQETSDAGTVHRSLSDAFKLDPAHKPADLQLVDEVNSTNIEQINDEQDTKDSDDHHQDNQAITGLMAIEETITETHLQQQAVDDGQHCAGHQIDKRKAEAESRKAEKARSGQSSAPVESKKAEKTGKARAGQSAAPPESKKAEKATSMQGNPANKSYNIDSLLSEAGSIFTSVQSRPLPSARFSHKKASKLSGLDRPLSPLKMSRPILKRGDTLDATWKAICESKRHSSPLNRHSSSKHTRKVDPTEDILEGIAHKPTVSSPSPLSPIKQRSKIIMNLHEKEVLAKANTLKRREPSMPQEELNAKVESFISRFNEQIRIQREKSLLEYMEMVGRGSS